MSNHVVEFNPKDLTIAQVEQIENVVGRPVLGELGDKKLFRADLLRALAIVVGGVPAAEAGDVRLGDINAVQSADPTQASSS